MPKKLSRRIRELQAKVEDRLYEPLEGAATAQRNGNC